MFARIASLCLLALGPGGFAEAARPGCELPLERWNRLVVTHDEGLPLDTVNALAEDGHGFLWVGTEDGLARFDGREFDRVDLGPALDYAAEIIQALEPGDAGTLHVGTLSSGVVEVHTRGPALPSKTSALDPRVFDLARAPDGRVIAATGGNGLLITVPGGDTEEPRTGRAGDAARVVAPRARGGWWVGYDGLGLQWFDGERFHDVPAAETLEDAFVTALTETHDGALWIGTREGLFTLDDAGARRIDALPADAFVRALLQDSDGRLWLGTDDGAVARLCEGRFDVLAEPAGPGSAFVSDLIEDHAGGIWVATGGSGIVRLESHGVVPLTPRHGVPEAPVLPIVEDAHGTLWLGTFGGGIAGFADGRVTRLTADDGLPSDRVLSLLPARGGVWVGTRSGLAEVRDGTVQRAWASLEGLPHLTIGAMADDGDTLWLGTLAGLVAFDDEGMRIVERDFGAPITALRVDRGGTLWIGTDGEGAFVRRPGGPIEPAPFSDRLPSPAIMALYESRSASLWVATALGLLRWDGQRAVVIDRRHGLPESRAFSIAEDGVGGFWLSGNRGVFRLDAAEMEAFEPAGSRHLSPALRIDADDGMPRTETNGGFQPAVWRDGRGRLWYPTSSG
ncbi:MAG: two-component regulator propeller domain-containing protein, partial [Wenzhouxiangellaceae bacterium]|nr:two-component regulator propeller domain-containing protein [Wenzhouxiangellaceae bacterium]